MRRVRLSRGNRSGITMANYGRVLLQACRGASSVREASSRDFVHRAVVVGAGVEGSSAALHIARCEAGPVLLLEQVTSVQGQHVGEDYMY